jgi:hypothetical protein
MGASGDCWNLLSKIAAHGRRLQASEEVAHWTLRIIIESHMRSTAFTQDALRELSAILGSEPLRGIIEGLLEGDAVRIVSAVEPRSARRAADDPAWARRRLLALATNPNAAPNEDPDSVVGIPHPPVVRVFSKHRSMGARRRSIAERAMLHDNLIERN